MIDWALVTRYFGGERQLGLELHNRGGRGAVEFAVGAWGGTTMRAAHGQGVAPVYGEAVENLSDLRALHTPDSSHPELGGRVGSTSSRAGWWCASSTRPSRGRAISGGSAPSASRVRATSSAGARRCRSRSERGVEGAPRTRHREVMRNTVETCFKWCGARRIATLALALVVGCARTPARVATGAAPAQFPPRCETLGRRGDVQFPRSPGGALEVDAAWLAAHRCDARVVDVREADELSGPLGRVDVATWTPLADVEREAESWDRAEPVVIVCRSGRRSERAAERLRGLGFRRVASLTGGMLAWVAAGLPVSHAQLAPPTTPRRDARDEGRADALAGLRATLARPDALVWTRAASLLGANTVSCIDGRADGPVLGTPGGDAGELVLSLAALEEMLHHPVEAAWIAAIFDRYVEAFGRFYVHTDHHALARLGEALGRDARFRETASRWASPDDVAAFVRAPPPALEDALLDRLTEPAHVGCGHLRLMMQSPARYGMRDGLVADVLRAAFRRGWRRPELLEYARLDGEHEERGVLEVWLDHEVHAHTLVPMVTPHVGAREFFVLHPQVIDFVRAENAWFLVEQLAPQAAAGVDPQALHAHIAALGARQLAATVAQLAPHLPHFRLTVTASGHTLERGDP